MNKYLKKLNCDTDNKSLQMKLMDTSHKYFNLRIQSKIGQLKQSHILKRTRRNIAYIKTIIHQK